MRYYRWEAEGVEPVVFRLGDGYAEVLRDSVWVESEDPTFWLELLQEPAVVPLTEDEVATYS